MSLDIATEITDMRGRQKMEGGLRHLHEKTPPSLYTVVALVALVTLLALLLRMLLLADDSLWGDEIISVQQAQLNSEDFWEFTSRIPGMTLYYVLLRFWLLLGDSDFIIRSLSVIPAIATIPVIYLLGARLFGVRVGLICAVLLAVNAFHIQYSQEARSYTLLVLLVTLSSFFFVKLVERPSWVTWVGYVATSALAFYAHWFGIFVVVAQLGSVIFLRWREIPWTALITSGAAIGLMLLPVALGQLLEASSSALGTNNWRPAISWPLFHQFINELTGSSGDLLVVIYSVLILLAGVVAASAWFYSKASFEGWKYVFLIMWLIVPILLLLGFSIWVTPAFISRYLITCLPPLVLLASVCISEMPFKSVSLALVAVLVALSGKGVLAYYEDFEKEDWRGAAWVMVSNWEPGDGIIYYVPHGQSKLEYYVQKFSSGVLDGRPIIPYYTWRRFLQEEPDRSAIAQFIPTGYNRIWLVLSRDQRLEEQKVSNEIKFGLKAKYQFSSTSKHPKVNLMLFGNEDLPYILNDNQQGRCSNLTRDYGSSTSHGLPFSEPTPTEGQLGGALEFDGEKDYVLVGDVHGFEDNSPFTVSMWAKDDGSSGVYGRLISKEKSVSPREGWLIFRYKNSDRYGFERWEDGAHDTVGFSYTSGQWNHIAFTFDGAHMRGYLNGVPVAEPIESSKSVQPTFNPLVIGARSDSEHDFYQGALDDIRIYSHALSSEEIAEVAQAAGHSEKAGNGLVSHWKFDEVSGEVATGCGGEDSYSFAPVVEPVSPQPTTGPALGNPIPDPEVTPAPTFAPNVDPEPTPAPTVTPTLVSASTPAATSSPTATPAPSPTPTLTPVPTVAPTPVPDTLADEESSESPGGVAFYHNSPFTYVTDTSNDRVQVFNTGGARVNQSGQPMGRPGKRRGAV